MIAKESEMFTHSANNMFVFFFFFLTLFNCNGKRVSIWLNSSHPVLLRRDDAPRERWQGVWSCCPTAGQNQPSHSMTPICCLALCLRTSVTVCAYVQPALLCAAINYGEVMGRDEPFVATGRAASPHPTLIPLNLSFPRSSVNKTFNLLAVQGHLLASN